MTGDLIDVPTEFTLSLLPLDHPSARSFWITLEWRGMRAGRDGRVCWAVVHADRTLSRTGDWDLSDGPGSYTEWWLDKHRFTFDEAHERAVAALPRVRVGGMRAADVLPLVTAPPTPAVAEPAEDDQ